MSKLRNISRSRRTALALEPRMLFDGAAADAVLLHFDQRDPEIAERHSDTAPNPLVPSLADTSTAAPPALILVDARVATPELLGGLPADANIRLVDGASSGLQMLEHAAAQHPGLTSIHLLVHGSSGVFQLGSDTLDSAALAANGYAGSQLAALGGHLAANADILIYGCSVAQGSNGDTFVTRLAQLTGADIAASTNLTGAASKGGDWVLEAQTGTIETAALAVAGFDGLLASPVNTVPGARTVAEDNIITFSGGAVISIADSDGSVSSVSLTVSHGTLTLADTSGLTQSGNGTGSISITGGTIAQINAALNGLVYTPASNYSGADTLTIVTGDGSSTDTDTIGITVTANASAPVLTLPATAQTVAEDITSYLDFTGANAIVLTDADANDRQTLTLSVAHGVLNVTAVGGASVTSGNGSASVVLSGTAAQLSATLASATGVQYTSALNYNSSAGLGSEAISFSLNDGVHTQTGNVTINVTQANDAPNLSTGVAATVQEGGSVALSRAQLASSDNLLDVDVQTGQQVVAQLMVKIDSLPSSGTLRYNNGVVVIGSVVPVSALGNLTYTHNGTDIVTNQADSFNVTVSDGGGGATAGTVLLAITPRNVAPTISGSPSLIEGQVKVVAPTISLGDGYDTLANSTIVIDNIVTGGQGTLFIDADNDNVLDVGEELTGSTTLSSAQSTNLATQLKFFQNGAEPNAPGAIAPSYRIAVTDAGGGTGVPSAPVVQTVTLDILPNNDDPTLTNLHPIAGSALAVGEGTKTIVITSAMLAIADLDRDPSAPATNTTPAEQLVFTIASRPAQGEIQLFIGGGAGPENDGWIVLGDNGRFTQAQVAAGNVRYYQTTDVPDGAATLDQFTFTVRDSAFGYDVWTDPANPSSGREGGLRDTPTGAIATQEFHFRITPLASSATPRPNTDYTGAPRPATSGYGDSSTPMVYSFTPTGGMLSNNSTAGGAWVEANVGAVAGGYVITDTMLSYTITRTDTKGTPATGDDISVVVPPGETVYTLTVQPPNGLVQIKVGAAWENIPTNGQFTQADINAGNIRFVHDGGEDHAATFGYKVSDGTPNHYTATFGLDITPTNDRPAGNSGSAAQVTEGNGNAVRLTAVTIGMSDVDNSLDGKVGEGLQDFLWFKVTGLAVDGGSTPRGSLERWNGSAWVALATTDWLPSSLLTTAADGGTSGLRYVHDGSEPLAYAGGAKVTFTYMVRDDLADPANPLATNVTAPAITDGSAQSNQSANVTATINIIPVNNAPIVADKPGDADPTIGGTITNGGALTGVNEVLTIAVEGGDSVISSAYLVGVDPDNTTVQRQFIVKSAPSQGILLLNDKLLGVGSTFTQDDIDNSRVKYRHNGNEILTPTTDGLGTYNDKFHFVLSDAVFEDTGAGASNWNTFLIQLTPTNDAPTITGPSGIILIDSATPANNPVSGFVVADPDLTDNVLPGQEADFVQVTVRLLDSGGNPIANHATGFAGGGVSFGYTAQAGGLWNVTQNGVNNILQFQGTRAQVNAALAGLTVTFANDTNSMYKLQVIVDDRMRDVAGVLTAAVGDANGGELNQGASAGAAPTAVPNTEYNWLTQATLAATDPNIASTTADLRASLVNETPTFTGPAVASVDEDARTQVSGGFVINDPESAAFGTPVTVTVSVPSGQGTLGVGSSAAQTSLTPAGGQAVTITGDNSRSITLTGRAADIQALLNGRNFANSANDASGGLFYTTASNVNHDVNVAGDGDVSLTLAFADTGSVFGSDSGTGSVSANPANIISALTINAINDAPVVNRTATPVAIAGTGATAVSGFSIADVDSSDGYATGESDVVMQATVRILNASGTPLAAVDYTNLGITLDTSAAGHGATVDSSLTGAVSALEIRGTLAQLNAYLAGLQVTMANLGSANLDSAYSVEVIADDRLRDGTAGGGTIFSATANGGTLNQTDLAAVPTTDTFDPYATSVATYNLFNVTRNTRPLFISSINDPGTITASDVTVNEGSATLVLNASNANIILADPDDNGSTTISATVSVSKGSITAVGGSGGSVGGTGTSTVTITGATETELNARLKALTVTYPDPAGDATAADWNGNFTVTVVYNDNGNTGTRPGTLTGDTNDATANPGDFAYADGVSNVLITTRTFTVTVTGVNDAPIRTAASVTVPTATTEDTDGDAGKQTVAALFGSVFSDAKDTVADGSSAGSMAGVAVTTNGAIAAQGKWQYSTDGTAWADLPAVDTTTAFLLKTTDYLRFDPAADFHGTPGGLTVRLVDDSGGALTTGTVVNVTTSGGSTRYSDSSNAVALTTSVTNVNDAPSLSGAHTLSVSEDATNPAGTTVATVVATGLSYGDVTDTQTAITGGGNAATGQTALAITGNAANTTTEGRWQYTLNGSAWVDVPTAIDNASAVVLQLSDGNHQLRFVPVAGYFGAPGSLTVRSADGTWDTNTGIRDISAQIGTTNAWSASTGTVAITVLKANDAPVINNLDVTSVNTYVEGQDTAVDRTLVGTPVLVDTSVTITDVELTGTAEDNFAGTTLTIARSNGTTGFAASAQDQIGIQHQGVGVGQVGLSGANVQYNGVTVGAYSLVGGTLTVTFNATASSTAVNAVASAITYANSSDTPPADITLRYRFNDDNAAGTPQGTGGSLTGDAIIRINITAANDMPLAVDDTHAVTEDGSNPVNGNALTGAGSPNTTADSDPENDVLTVTGIRTGSELAGGAFSTVAVGSTSANGRSVVGTYGTLVIGADGSYSYTLDNTNTAVNALNSGQTLTELFAYEMSDGTASDIAQITITINGSTDGAPAIVSVDDNAAANGEETVYEAGLVSPANTTETTTGTINVTALDGIASVSVGGTSFTVSQLAALSVGSPSAAIDTGEGLLRVTGIANSLGPVGAPTSFELNYSYTLKAPITNVAGADEFLDTIALQVTDASSGTPDTATGNLVVRIVDDAPAASANTNSVLAGQTLNVAAGVGVTGNDLPGADGWALAGPVVGVVAGAGGTPTTGVAAPIAGAFGTLTLNANGSYTYVAAPAAPTAPPTVTDVFTYTVRDLDGDTVTTTLTITVQNNQPPVANADTRSTPEDVPVGGNVLNGSGGDVPDSDPDGDPITVTGFEISGVSYLPGSTAVISGIGSLTLGGNGTYTFTPLPNWNGIVPSVTYTIADDKGLTATATLNISVIPVNDPPVATNNTNTVTEDSPVPVTGDVRSDATPDSDPDTSFNSLTVTQIRPAASGVTSNVASGSSASTNPSVVVGQYGTLTLGADGSYSYALNNNLPAVNALTTGSTLNDVFVYTLSDGSATSSALLTITIQGHTDGTPSINSVDSNAGASGQSTVREAGLLSAGDSSEIATGSIAISAADGVAAVTIGGKPVLRSQLEALGTSPITIDTGEGVLTLIGYTSNGNIGGVTTGGMIDYRYTLKAAISQPGASESLDQIPLAITSEGGATASGTLVVQIIDHTPTANPDTQSLTRGTSANPAANVLGNVFANGNGGDAADALGADTNAGTLAAPVTALFFGGNAGVLGRPLAGAYGSLTLNPDGSYSYDLDDSNAAVRALPVGASLSEVFVYEIADADGDKSSATLTIRIGANSSEPPPVTPPVTPPVIPPVQPPVTPPQEPPVFIPVDTGSAVRPSPGDKPDPAAPTETAAPRFITQPNDMAREPSVFFDGAVFDRVLRMPIPFHPITYVNLAVQMAQAEREGTDSRTNGAQVDSVRSPEIRSLSLGAGLGFDPVLYVTPAVRWAQHESDRLDNLVEARLSRLNLSSDRLLTTPDLHNPLPGMQVLSVGGERGSKAPDGSGERLVVNPDVPLSARPGAEVNAGGAGSVRSAPAFSEQLRQSRRFPGRR